METAARRDAVMSSSFFGLGGVGCRCHDEMNPEIALHCPSDRAALECRLMTVFGSSDLAIDIGTATTRVAGGRSGLCLSPSAFQQVRALNCGVIVDLQAATDVLRPMMQQRRGLGMNRLRVLACAPSDVSALERYSVKTCGMLS